MKMAAEEEEESLLGTYFLSHELGTTLEGNVLISCHKIFKFKRKLNLWGNRVVKEILKCFHCCLDLRLRISSFIENKLDEL